MKKRTTIVLSVSVLLAVACVTLIIIYKFYRPSSTSTNAVGVISGTLKTPYAKTTVLALAQNGKNAGSADIADDGTYLIRGLPTGIYNLRLQAGDYSVIGTLEKNDIPISERQQIDKVLNILIIKPLLTNSEKCARSPSF